MGMLRVLKTIIHSEFADDLALEQEDLRNWAFEIVEAIAPYQVIQTYLLTLSSPSVFQ